MTSVFDYVVKPPVGYKKLKKRKIILIFVYTVIAIVGVCAGLLTWQYGLLFPIVALTVGIDAVAVVFTWKKTRPEYEYLIEAGEFSFSAIYGGRARRTVLTLDLAAAIFIAPNNGTYETRLRDFSPKKEINGVFSEEQRNYFMLFNDENDEPTVFYFNADTELVRAIRKYNAKIVVAHKIES